MSALSPIQSAIYTKLSGDSTLMGMVTGIFDNVPQNQTYPYIDIGETTQVPFRTFGKKGYDTTLTLHIWNRRQGFKSSQDILARVNALLDEQPLTITGFNDVFTIFEMSDSLKDPDGITNQIIARYRIVVQAP